jgi:hypothetical protein
VKKAGGRRGCLWIAILLAAVAIAGAQQTPKAQKAASVKAEEKPSSSAPASNGFDQLLSDIDKDRDAEARLERYLDLAKTKSVPAGTSKAANEKAAQLLKDKAAALNAAGSAALSAAHDPPDWDSAEKAYQDAVKSFPTPELRLALGNFLLARAKHEIRSKDLNSARTLIGRAQELGVDDTALKAALAHVQEEENSWGGKTWAAIKNGARTVWKVITGILGSAHVWALVGIAFVIWTYRKLRGNKKDYQFEPFIVVEQHAADAKDKIYPGLTARLLKEMRRVAEIHQGSSQKALDEISDPLGNSVPINFTEYEPELTSKIEQIPEISVGSVKLPLVSYLAILLRVNVKRVRTYYEEFSHGASTRLRLMADMRGTRSLVADAGYEEPKPPGSARAAPPNLTLLFPNGNHAPTVDNSNGSPASPPKAEVLDQLITRLACEVRFSRIMDEKSRRATRGNESYSRSAEVYREFTLGLDAQHEAAQTMHSASRVAEQLNKAAAKLQEARDRYTNAIARQSDHAAAYFCRAGISLQEAQIEKTRPGYEPDTPETPEAFAQAPSRTKIDDAIDDYRRAAQLGRAHLRGLSYFNLANIFYRLHRCDAYEKALEYAAQADSEFKRALNAGQTEASELRRRVSLLKVSILIDKAGNCELSSLRDGTPAVAIRELLLGFKEEEGEQPSEYWRVSAKACVMQVKELLDGADAEAQRLLPRVLREAMTNIQRAIEIDPGVAENYNTLGAVLFAKLSYLDSAHKNNSAEYGECKREILNMYDRACSLSTHEFFFYNRAIARKNFIPGEDEKTECDFRRACATIANGQRSSVALFSYASFLEERSQALQGESYELARKNRVAAAEKRGFAEKMKRLAEVCKMAAAGDSGSKKAVSFAEKLSKAAERPKLRVKIRMRRLPIRRRRRLWTP